MCQRQCRFNRDTVKRKTEWQHANAPKSLDCRKSKAVHSRTKRRQLQLLLDSRLVLVRQIHHMCVCESRKDTSFKMTSELLCPLEYQPRWLSCQDKKDQQANADKQKGSKRTKKTKKTKHQKSKNTKTTKTKTRTLLCRQKIGRSSATRRCIAASGLKSPR